MTLQWLTDPFLLEVQRRALVEVLLSGGLGGALGCYVIFRRLGFMTDALSHAVLPGVVIAFLLTGAAGILYGALAAGAVAAVSIGFITRDQRIQEDAAIGVVLTGAFALGIVLISTVHSYATALEDFLFGNVLLVSPEDLWLTLGLSAVVAAVLLIFHRRFVLRAFDPGLAEAMGLRGLLLDLLLLLLLAATVVVSLRAIGNILVVAFLITPAATARLLTVRVPRMLLLSACLGAFSGAAGLVIAYYLNVSSGSLIVCLSTLLFLVVLICEPRRGALARRLRPTRPAKEDQPRFHHG
ncbi:MAG: metal ABC transporter permease [Candidatus Dormibacteraeota bacterium]|uniref:Metal ABC transporter permease n=1 Tax=Candidatus Dormiibacter inghamiae TaxID=3127013 RepID=A0A934KB19_9BACT|nr:metal ABC transporter permease [Candidatus Dormibacteraeota bacterium]MBJ7606276.1 metal ABC transporter permease [Candidatus Dormibacteraeota bacterium]